ncbi:unnamed protein product [Urochloa humidicola]
MGSSPLFPPPCAAVALALRVHHSARDGVSLLSLFIAPFSLTQSWTETVKSPGSVRCRALPLDAAGRIVGRQAPNSPTMLLLPSSRAWVPARAAAPTRYWMAVFFFFLKGISD